MLAAKWILCLAGTIAVQDYPSPDGVEHVRITRPQFHDHINSLPLDAARLEEARALFAGYTGDFEELIKAYKLAHLWSDSTSAVPYDAQDDDLWRHMEDDRDQLEMIWQRDARNLSDDYFDRLESLAPAYADVIKRHRRDQLVRRALGQLVLYVSHAIFSEDVAGELDLTSIAVEHGARVDAESIVAYESQFIPLIECIDDYIWKRMTERREARRLRTEMRLRGTPEQYEKAINDYVRLLAEGLQLGWDLRQLNLEFALRIEADVPEAEHAAYRSDVDRALHPYLEAETGEPIEQRIAAALERGDLSAAQRSQLRDLQVTIDAERARQRRSMGSLYATTIDPELIRRRTLAGLRVGRFDQDSAGRQAAIDHANALQREAGEVEATLGAAMDAWRVQLERFDRQLRGITGESEDDE